MVKKKLHKSLNEISIDDANKVIIELKDNNVLFKLDFEHISKYFLSKFLVVNAFSTEFDMLLKEYLFNIGYSKTTPKDLKPDSSLSRNQIMEIENAIQNEMQFHTYICKYHLNLVREPKEVLLITYELVREDLQDINNTLENLKKEIDAISKNNSTDIQVNKPILLYYQKHNQDAQAEILLFLKDRIYDFALRNCYEHDQIDKLFICIPYDYKWDKPSYMPKQISGIQNKCKDLKIQEHKDLSVLFFNDKPEFYKYLRNYITQRNIDSEILDLLHQSHVLYLRKEIIIELIGTFNDGKKAMFANAVPTIIEGILHDICILNGEDENELLQQGFQYKLDKLQNIFMFETHYEYYSFWFRAFRNKVAHGRLTMEEAGELADFLLLDLLDICKLTLTRKLELNRKIFLVKKLNEDFTQPDYEDLLWYLLLKKIVIPTFYGLNHQIEEVENIIQTNEFWEFLEEQIDRGIDSIKHGMYKILGIIKDQKKLDERRIRLLRKIAIKKADNGLANSYFKFLKSRHFPF